MGGSVDGGDLGFAAALDRSVSLGPAGRSSCNPFGVLRLGAEGSGPVSADFIYRAFVYGSVWFDARELDQAILFIKRKSQPNS